MFFYPMEQLAARCLLWLSEKEKIFLVYIWESKKPSSYNIYTAVVMWRSLEFIKNVTQSVSDLTLWGIGWRPESLQPKSKFRWCVTAQWAPLMWEI